MDEVQKFYDEWTTKQLKSGINHRHLRIFDWLKQFGLKKDHRVLEIGSGIGTVTTLILRNLSKSGSLVGLDISPKSIKLAKNALKKCQNVELHVGTIETVRINEKFDIIVLPDVIEHIPIKDHKILFKKVDGLLKDTGFVLIHMPDPDYLQWCITNQSASLQIIDQPIFTEILLDSLRNTDLKIFYMESYSIFTLSPDYQVIVLKKKCQLDYQPARPNPIPMIKRIKNKLNAIAKSF